MTTTPGSTRSTLEGTSPSLRLNQLRTPQRDPVRGKEVKRLVREA